MAAPKIGEIISAKKRYLAMTKSILLLRLGRKPYHNNLKPCHNKP